MRTVSSTRHTNVYTPAAKKLLLAATSRALASGPAKRSAVGRQMFRVTPDSLAREKLRRR